MRTILKRFVLSAPLALIMALAVPASASAATYDGTDPSGTGCASSAYTEFSVSNVDGFGSYLEFRYSPTCTTAWARFTCHADNGCFDFWINIVRSDGSYQYVEVDWPNWMWSGDQLYTMQLNDGTSYTAEACYHDDNRDTNHCSNWF